MATQCREVGISFIDDAEVKIINVVEIKASPEAIFKVFEDAQSWPIWFKGITAVEWTSSKPFGVGTTRTVSLGAMKVWEHFFLWEQNKRFSFYFTQTSLPLFKALVEDYRLEAIDEHTTRFTYTVAYDRALPLLLAGALGKRALRKNFGRAAKSLVTYMERKSK